MYLWKKKKKKKGNLSWVNVDSPVATNYSHKSTPSMPHRGRTSKKCKPRQLKCIWQIFLILLGLIGSFLCQVIRVLHQVCEEKLKKCVCECKECSATCIMLLNSVTQEEGEFHIPMIQVALSLALMYSMAAHRRLWNAYPFLCYILCIFPTRK